MKRRTIYLGIPGLEKIELSGKVLVDFLEHSLYNIAIYDHENKYHYINPMARELLGIKESEVKDFKTESVIPPEYHYVLEKLRKDREQGNHSGRYSLEIFNRFKERIPVEVVYYPIEIHGQSMYIGFLNNVGHQKRYRESLSILRKHVSKLNNATNIYEVAERTLDIVEDIMGFDLAMFSWIINDEINILASRGIEIDRSKVLPLDGKGISVRAINRKESQLVLDVDKDPDFVSEPLDEESEIRSELHVPIIIDDNVAGLITLQSTQVNRYSESSLYIMEVLASNIAMTMPNLRYREQLNAIIHYGRQLSNALDLDDVAKTTLDFVTSILDADMASFDMVEDGFLVPILQIPNLSENKVPLTKKGVTIKVALNGESILLDDTRKCVFFHQGWMNSLSELTVPVISGGRPIAVINAESKRLAAFTESDKSTLEIFAEEISLAVNRINSYNLLQRSEESYRDLVESINEGIIKTNVDGKIVFSNKIMADYLGLQESDLIGKSVFDLYPEEEKEIVLNYNQRRRQGFTNVYESKMIHSDGSHIPLLIQAAPLFDENKEYLGVISGLLDISERSEAQEKLKKSEEQFRDLLNYIPEPVMVNDSERYLFANQAAADTYGYDSPSDIVGTEYKYFFPPEIRENIIERAKERLEGRDPPEVYDTVMLSKTGERIPVEVSLRLIEYEGKPAVIGISLDKRERYAQERKLKALYEHSSKLERAQTIDEVYQVTYDAIQSALRGEIFDLIVVEGDKLVDVFTNTGKFEIGINEKSITGRAARLGKTQLVNDVRNDPDYVNVYSTDIQSEIAVPIIVAGNVFSLLNVESKEKNAFTQQDREILETFAINIANAVERLNRVETLERTVSERTSELENSNVRLQNLDKMKDRFISLAAHELRTPLTSIKGYLEILEPAIEQVNEDYRQYYDVLKRNTYRLEKITDDLLNQQRIETGRFVVDKHGVDIYEVINGALNEVQPIVEAKGIQVEKDIIHGIPEVQADSIRLTQVLVNLLDNAVKFSEKNSAIKLSLTYNDEEVTVSVEDDGIGVCEQDMDKLFAPFPDIEKPDFYQGTGLGLSICKGIIEHHEGKMWAERKPKGIRFNFTLPL